MYVASVEVEEQLRGGCSFMLWGWWWGLPWCKSFDMRRARSMKHSSKATPSRFEGGEHGGFHAALRDGGWGAWLPAAAHFRGGGGFAVRPGTDAATTRLAHYERYGWPIVFPLVWVLAAGCWREWHLRGMEVEMDVIRAQAPLPSVHATQQLSPFLPNFY